MPMIMPSEESSAVEMSQWRAKLTKVSDFLLLTEPVWVSAAASFVYLSVISEWMSFVPWLCLAFAFAPFLLRLIRYGRPSHCTPFDIPIAVLLGGMIVGIAVSEQFDVSLGAFQTFLAATAFYYSVSNYSKPSRLIMIGLPLALVGAIIASVFAAKWVFGDNQVPHGLGIALAIMGAISICITIFARQIIQRMVSGLFSLMLLVAAILFTDESLNRLVTLESIESRMRLWIKVISPIEGSSLWTGQGLGCWPLVYVQDQAWLGHVHNAYLELYVNTGVFGLAALICFLAVGAKLAADILYCPRDGLYYSFGVGVILAALVVLAMSFLESATFGFGFFHEGSYHYIMSPIPFILAGSLVIARRFLRERFTT